MASKYFNWLVRKISTREQAKKYSNLFELLNEIEFVWLHDLDQNRVADAIEMRAKYEQANDEQIDTRPASVLEVLVAMSIRCEDGVMGDFDKGDRTSEWFWVMMDNSGLSYYTNNQWNEKDAREDIQNAVLRKYNRNGSNGGFFYIPDTTKDLRKVDIWMQMMWWLSRNKEE